MKNIFLILFTLSLTYSTASAQITFQKTFSTHSSRGTAVQQTNDGGYIIAGISDSLDGYALLIKVSNQGVTEWSKTIGGDDKCAAQSVQQISDGGFIVAGYTYGFGATQSEVFLVRTDNLGNIVWSKMYGAGSYQDGYAVLQTTDGGFIVSGSAQVGSNIEVYLVRTNSNGDLLWTKTIGASNYEYGNSILQHSDGGFIIAGFKRSFTYGDDVCLLKTDSMGNLQWIKTYGSLEEDRGYDVNRTADNGYIITGSTYGYGAGNKDVFLIKTDSSGNPQWAKTYGGTLNDEGNSVQQTLDGGYIITGYASLSGSWDAFLLKTDFNGNLLWSKLFGGAGSEMGKSVQQTTDDGYILVGEASNEIYLIKADSSGNSGCNESAATVSTSSPSILVNNPPVLVSTFGTGFPVAAAVGGGVTSSSNCSSCQPCPTPSNLSISNLSSTSVKLKWNVTACAIGYKVKYRPYGSTTWINKTVNGNTGFKNINGLIPNTQYQWQVRTKCSSNPNVWSAWSGNSFFTTPQRLGELEKEVITLSIYPNPATDQLNITTDHFEISRLQIANTLGQVVLFQNLSTQYSILTTQIDVSTLPAGVYLLNAFINQQQVTKMFVKE